MGVAYSSFGLISVLYATSLVCLLSHFVFKNIGFEDKLTNQFDLYLFQRMLLLKDIQRLIAVIGL